jgi:hypothetical protein
MYSNRSRNCTTSRNCRILIHSLLTGDDEIEKAMMRVSPTAGHMLCTFHVNNNIQVKIRPEIRNQYNAESARPIAQFVNGKCLRQEREKFGKIIGKISARNIKKNIPRRLLIFAITLSPRKSRKSSHIGAILISIGESKPRRPPRACIMP